jgi:hypothetical protein
LRGDLEEGQNDGRGLLLRQRGMAYGITHVYARHGAEHRRHTRGSDAWHWPERWSRRCVISLMQEGHSQSFNAKKEFLYGNVQS